MNKISTDVLILGGGWTGLSAAYMLGVENKKKIVVLEKEAVGGLLRTLDFAGFKFDIGGHRIFFYEKRNIDYLKQLSQEGDFLKLKRKIKIFLDGKYIDYPPSLASVLNLHKRYFLPVMRDMLFLKRKNNPENFEEWVKANYGQSLFSIYFKDYTTKVWGEPCINLSSNWAEKRVGQNDLFNLFKGLILSDYESKEVTPNFYYPKGGIGVLVDSLQAKIEKSARIFSGVTLAGFSGLNGKLRSLSFCYDNQDFDISFNHVFSTIPIRELVGQLPGSTQAHMQEAVGNIRYRSLIVVAVILNQKLATNWHWCYFPSRDIIFSRIHEPKFWSAQMASENKTCLVLEIFCNRDDAYWHMNNDEILKRAAEGLVAADLIKNTGVVHDGLVKRIEHAYPLCYKGFEAPLNKIKEQLSPFNNLCLIGRTGAHAYYDMEECLDDAREKIRHLL